MQKLYDWSYEVDRSFVLVRFADSMKKQILAAIKRFGGQKVPVKTKEQEVVAKFNNSKTLTDFVQFLCKNYPNSFHLNNQWETLKASKAVTFTSMKDTDSSPRSIRETINSFLDDFETISELTEYKCSDVKLEADSLVFLTFTIVFDSDEEAKEFIYRFNKFKHHAL